LTLNTIGLPAESRSVVQLKSHPEIGGVAVGYAKRGGESVKVEPFARRDRETGDVDEIRIEGPIDPAIPDRSLVSAGPGR
jgi:hypothetical protein